MTSRVDHDEVWKAIDAQRTSLTGTLAALSDEEWTRPSLCDGWTTRDVAGHLTMAQSTLRTMPAAMVELARARGNLDRAIRDAARRRALAPPDQLIARIRGMVGSRKHNVGVSPTGTLLDILVHTQDILVPLNRRLPMAPDAASLAATNAWTHRGWPFYAQQKFRGFQLVASDVSWTAGEGRAVEAPIEALLLLLTDRLIATPQLSGEGAADLSAQLRKTP